MVLGLNQSLTSAAQIVAPVIAGTLIEAGRLFTWAALAAAAAAVGLLLARWGSARASAVARAAPGA